MATGARGWLQSQLFGISANDLWSPLTAVTVVTVTAVIATYLPAQRASSLAPAAALREN
jgi:ABC-type lipoprotein release transport system permease subunit